MKTVFLTPGTGGWYCGVCMRDNALARALVRAGHEVRIVPVYLPLHLDEELACGSGGHPVAFGGINLYLQGKSGFFRHLPVGVRRLLDHPRVLRLASRASGMTSPEKLGAMTLAMLRCEEGPMSGEMERLCDWLEEEKPDVIALSTALQAGMIRMLKHRTGAVVVCGFQGEDGFLDGLPSPWREDCWHEMGLRVAEADARVAPSRFYAEWMCRRIGDGAGGIDVFPNGIDTAAFSAARDSSSTGVPVIGYLARMCREKGLEVMVDAFIRLRGTAGCPDVRLHLAGTRTAEDEGLIRRLKARLDEAGLSGAVSWMPDISREEKITMLRGVDVFSVPALCHEAFGLYTIEAMAAGCAVVQPDWAAFPEILGDAGVLVPVGDASALAAAWRDLLDHPQRAEDLGRRAQVTAARRFDESVMCRGFLDLVERVFAARKGPGVP